MTVQQADTDYYAVLGVSSDASSDTIKAAFRRRAMECHPDRGGSHDGMVAVCQAAEILLNPESRALYDKMRASANDQRALTVWRGIVDAAYVEAQSYPKTWPGFQAWLDQGAAEVQGTRAGRAAAGAVAGALLGVVLGAVVGSLAGIGFMAGGGVGFTMGLLCGALAGSLSRTRAS